MKMIAKGTKLEYLDETGKWSEIGKILDFNNEENSVGEAAKGIDFSCAGRTSVNVGSFTERPEWQPALGHRPEGRKSDRKRNRKKSMEIITKKEARQVRVFYFSILLILNAR